MLRQVYIDTISMPVATSDTQNSWKSWILAGVELLMSDVARSVEIFALWQSRITARLALAEFDERLLRDVGLTHAQVLRESKKPFWRP